MNLSECVRVIDRYIAEYGKGSAGLILRAAESYRVALESFHSRPEIALAMFCSTLEALLPLKDYSDIDLYDNSLALVFKNIAAYCPRGEIIVRGLKSRLFQIKRKVASFVGQYVPESYFEQPEAAFHWGMAKNRAELISRIRCVYDVRSRVLHAGERRGLWYLEHDSERSEVGIGSPVLDDKELQKLLAGALTLTGMERVTSTVLRAVIAEWLGAPMASRPPTACTVPPTGR